MAESASALLKRDSALKSQQTTWLTRWQDIADFTAPERSRILQVTEGAVDATQLYDSTAIHASTLLASSIHGTMTPATQPWISFVMRDEEMNDQQDVREWLEDCATRMHKGLRQANFTTGVHEMYSDLVRFATAAILTEEKEPQAKGGFSGFRFTAVPIGTYRIAEDKDGLVDTLFRDLKLTRRVCVQMWKGKLGDEFEAKATDKPDEIVDVLHAVYPRRDRAYDAKGEAKGGARNLPWASCYVIRETKKLADEGGYEEFPYAVPRWSKIAGEVYGTGPSHTAIYDVKVLNAFTMYCLQALPLAAIPPSLERNDAVQGDVDRAPGGRIVVEGAGAVNEQFMFLDTKYKPDVVQESRVSMKQEIERAYHAQELQLRESPQMTATEVQVRYELMQRLLGPTTGRLESEFLNPLTWRCFAIMARRGAFKELPGSLQESVGQNAADLDVEYEGPLARAQRTIELTAQDRTVAFVVGYAQAVAPFAPDRAQEALDVLKIPKMTRSRAQITGLPTDELASEDEVKAVQDERKQAAGKQAQMNQMGQLAEAAGKVAPLVTAAQKPQSGQAKAA